MRRLPKQLILLEWKRSRLSTRRSRKRPIPIWPRRPPKKQGLVGAALASTMRSMAKAVPPPAAASTNEAAAKAAYLARMEAESPFRGVQLLRLSRFQPQRVQMRRLPKQLTLLDWK